MSQLRPRDFVISFQHLFAMFGATILVPLSTGLNPALALFTAGLGTLLFHLLTKFKVPVFLGSSFAFMPAITAIVMENGTPNPDKVPIAQGGIIAAGALYLIFALIVYLIGSQRIKRLFPPIVTGPVIIVIGVQLAGTAIGDATGWIDLTQPIDPNGALNIGIALFTIMVVVLTSVAAKGFFKLVPILIGIAAGYIVCVVLYLCGVFTMDFTPIANADWFNIPFVSKDSNGVMFGSLPQFDWGAILSIAPVALVTFMEHIGDITTNGMVVGKDFMKDPGLHRTLLGDGTATMLAGFLGGPPNTTYSENTGVLATTGNYNPALLRITACFAILLGLFGKFGAALQTIPKPVIGGVEVILFGMIASIGIRTLAESKMDFKYSRNLMIVGLILVLGLGISIKGGIPIQVGDNILTISGLFVAVVVGVLANALLPIDDEHKEAAKASK